MSIGNKLNSADFFLLIIYFHKYQLYCFFQLLMKKLTINVETVYNKITVRVMDWQYIDMTILTTSSNFFSNIFWNWADDNSVPVENFF